MTRTTSTITALMAAGFIAACGPAGSGGRHSSPDASAASTPSVGSDAPPPSTPSPVKVTVIIEGAVVAPSKVDRDCWDTIFCSISKSEWTAVISAAGGGLYSGVLGALAQVVIGATAKPDPFGELSVLGGPNFPKPLILVKRQDTFTPGWGDGWVNLEIDTGTRLRVELWDADVQFDDFIGTAHLDYSDLMAALNSGKVHHVPVGNQTNNQLLFIDISVVE